MFQLKLRLINLNNNEITGFEINIGIPEAAYHSRTMQNYSITSDHIKNGEVVNELLVNQDLIYRFAHLTINPNHESSDLSIAIAEHIDWVNVKGWLDEFLVDINDDEHSLSNTIHSFVNDAQSTVLSNSIDDFIKNNELTENIDDIKMNFNLNHLACDTEHCTINGVYYGANKMGVSESGNYEKLKTYQTLDELHTDFLEYYQNENQLTSKNKNKNTF